MDKLKLITLFLFALSISNVFGEITFTNIKNGSVVFEDGKGKGSADLFKLSDDGENVIDRRNFDGEASMLPASEEIEILENDISLYLIDAQYFWYYLKNLTSGNVSSDSVSLENGDFKVTNLRGKVKQGGDSYFKMILFKNVDINCSGFSRDIIENCLTSSRLAIPEVTIGVTEQNVGIINRLLGRKESESKYGKALESKKTNLKFVERSFSDIEGVVKNGKYQIITHYMFTKIVTEGDVYFNEKKSILSVGIESVNLEYFFSFDITETVKTVLETIEMVTLENGRIILEF